MIRNIALLALCTTFIWAMPAAAQLGLDPQQPNRGVQVQREQFDRGFFVPRYYYRDRYYRDRYWREPDTSVGRFQRGGAEDLFREDAFDEEPMTYLEQQRLRVRQRQEQQQQQVRDWQIRQRQRVYQQQVQPRGQQLNDWDVRQRDVEGYWLRPRQRIAAGRYAGDTFDREQQNQQYQRVQSNAFDNRRGERDASDEPRDVFDDPRYQQRPFSNEDDDVQSRREAFDRQWGTEADNPPAPQPER